MTDNNSDSDVKRRKVTEEPTEGNDGIEKKTTEEDKTAKDVIVDRTTWESVKYYFNRFRYYHFVVADAIDKYASAACLWLINMYFKLFMGIGSEAPSIINEVDE